MRQHRASAFAWPVWVPFMTAVVLGGAFGEASASGRQVGAATIEVDLSVEATEVEAVVAHLIEPGAEQQTVPLVDRGGGVFGIILELRKADYVVVFETFADGISNQSQPLRLTELGLDPALIGVLPFPTTTAPGYSSDTRMWGWAGLALAALALAFLAWWALPDRAPPPPPAPDPESVDTTP
ncbi:MAG TPA: hypothetical protein VFY46_02805 [Acidimicrobiia bacterium]|nr:hypothetical protein [Acidimicrobiia bacterium]